MEIKEITLEELRRFVKIQEEDFCIEVDLREVVKDEQRDSEPVRE